VANEKAMAMKCAAANPLVLTYHPPLSLPSFFHFLHPLQALSGGRPPVKQCVGFLCLIIYFSSAIIQPLIRPSLEDAARLLDSALEVEKRRAGANKQQGVSIHLMYM
jgi:hypothetical protein